MAVPLIKRQIELSEDKDLSKNRALNVTRKNDTVKDYTIKLIDIDKAIGYYLEEIALAEVKKNDESFKIPIIYGSPEKWKSAQVDRFYRDASNKIVVPLIMFKRNSISKNRDLSNKIDEEHPVTYMSFEKRWSSRNAYTQFNILNNLQPEREFYNVIVPEYVTLTYSFMIWTDKVADMNTIIEAINYSEGSYWGEPERFKFRARIDQFENITDLQDSNDRLVRSDFTLTIQGYIISDTLNRKIANTIPKTFSPTTVRFDETIYNEFDFK